MSTRTPHPKNFTGNRPKRPRGPSPGKKARMAIFARLWAGTITETLKLCRAEGLSIHEDTASAYVRDPGFIDLLRSRNPAKPGSGIWTVDELQRHLTRVSAGIELIGWDAVKETEQIIPGEDDYDPTKGGVQFRKVERDVPRYPRLADRLRACDSLARTIGAYLDKVAVTGDAKISVVELLDDDLKHAKPVLEVGTTGSVGKA